MLKIRKPVVAGTFYPSDYDQLEQMLDKEITKIIERCEYENWKMLPLVAVFQ